MIVFPRYKIPRHYKFHRQQKFNLKKIRRNIPEETTLSKPVGYFDFSNIFDLSFVLNSLQDINFIE